MRKRSELVTIRPRKDSKRFVARRGTMSQYASRIDENGNVQDVNAGEYNRERFPRSKQMFRPYWSYGKKRWLIEGFDRNSAELDDLVTQCKFKYPKTHPKRGEYIKTADLYDMADPFFTHKDFQLIANEGEIMLDKSSPQDLIMLKALMKHPEFAVGGENINPLLAANKRYIITDKNVDSKIKSEKRDNKVEAVKIYSKLSDLKKLNIAIALGAISNPNTDRELIDEVLWEYVDSDTKRDDFMTVAGLSVDELHLRKLMYTAKSKGVIRKQRDRGFMLFGNPIAKTEKQLLDYLANPDNQEMVIRIEAALEDK